MYGPTCHGAPSAALVTTLLALALALRSMRALKNLTLPTYDTDLLDAITAMSSSTSAAVGVTRGLTHLTLLADTLPFSFFDEFLVSNPTIQHLSLPNFIGVPPGPGEVHSAAIPNLISLDASPGLAVTLRVTSTLYDGLRPAAIFGALFGAGGGQVKVLKLVLAADVDRRTRGRLLGALAKTGEGLEVLELQLEGTSDEVALQVLYKQVATLLPNVCALHTLRLRAERTAKTVAETEEGPSRLALWTRSRSLGSALRCIAFPSGSRWELEQGEWVLRVD
ncbi:hypothetical protein BGY98DRAFT_990083 [Russula aff. rugulosa BPL654]|nr:hypothetical protein BGY98DRAFT_990083 [Russula aff. rugulosa BPL654]